MVFILRHHHKIQIQLILSSLPPANSCGLTLNGIAFFDYQLKSGSGFELSLGTAFVVREQRPDGLTRSYVASIEYQVSF